MTSRDLLRTVHGSLGHQSTCMTYWHYLVHILVVCDRFDANPDELIFPHCFIMGRSQNWPDLRSQISKFRDIRIVGTNELLKSWKFQNILSTTMAVAVPQSFLEVRSLRLTWWPDLRWPESKIFGEGAERMPGKVYQKTAGGVQKLPPPPHTHTWARVKARYSSKQRCAAPTFLAHLPRT